MAWLTLVAVAEQLACSPSHVRALARAAELADQSPESVPPRLRRYLGSGFPKPRLIGGSRRLPRIDEGELERWIRS